METVTCELCGSASHQVVLEQYDLAHRITDDLFTVVRCRICGLLFLNPRPTREEIGGYYPSTYYPAAPPRQAGDLKRAAKRWSAQVRRWIAQDFYGYPITDRARGWQWLRRLLLWPEYLWRRWRGRGLLPWVGRGRALDVGCGSGSNLVTLQEQGWEVSGVDASAVAVAQARSRFGDRVRQGDLLSMAYADRSFDTVLFSHVLEHLHGPLPLLKEVWRILDWGGRVVILCPNAGSLEARWFGRWWFPWELPRHLFHYEEASLTRALETAGFRVESITTGLGSLYFMASLDRLWEQRLGRPVPCRRLLEKVLVRPFCFVIGHLGYGTELKAYARKDPPARRD
ncbi:MAG: Ubiquinone biosynthesis O-methyltransferase [Nitrospirae bacterium]|nr:Ubiquinone biosynthesis O-methyltransferase [Nitrospirota bacterium]MCE7964286.1 class I SAM-dependent methyltransferase [Nitrospira sp. NTP2]MCK6492637.1 class I SAM-dependent methyltransferase [Nitrospira sp.]MEB2337292.1 class I SAM-dependent methyltransferase [Nitrospirales bacterium]QOJ36641.1 MAG: class I SAM-dependent methyltransferase [Nitrospira sp.]